MKKDLCLWLIVASLVYVYQPSPSEPHMQHTSELQTEIVNLQSSIFKWSIIYGILSMVYQIFASLLMRYGTQQDWTGMGSIMMDWDSCPVYINCTFFSCNSLILLKDITVPPLLTLSPVPSFIFLCTSLVYMSSLVALFRSLMPFPFCLFLWFHLMFVSLLPSLTALVSVLPHWVWLSQCQSTQP